jgi:hypothetical protein
MNMNNRESSTQRSMAARPPVKLPLLGVAFGALWIAGAFAALIDCFAINYANEPDDPGTELAIANAVRTRVAAEESHTFAERP